MPGSTVERCQHRRSRVGRAVRWTRLDPIRQKTAGHKSLWCRCCDWTKAKTRFWLVTITVIVWESDEKAGYKVCLVCAVAADTHIPVWQPFSVWTWVCRLSPYVLHPVVPNLRIVLAQSWTFHLLINIVLGRHICLNPAPESFTLGSRI